MTIEFTYLTDREDVIPIVARWYFDQRGYLVSGETLERSEERLRHALNRDRIPFVLLAVADSDAGGAAEIKYREMVDLFPDKEHWPGGVYVAAQHRGRGYGELLVREMARIAPRYGIQTLYL